MTTRTTPADCWIDAGDLRLHYLDWGTIGCPTMVLLHGGSQTAHSWDFFSRDMCREYHVLALDQRGHGDSGWPPHGDYSRAAHRRDIGRFFTALDLRDVILVGLSMGGKNAIGYTATSPERVRALVIVDTGPETLEEGRRYNRAFVEGPDVLEFDEFVERALRFNPHRQRDILRESIRHNLRQLADGKWTWKTDPRLRAGGRGLDSEAPAELWRQVEAIGCPTLLVRGADSHILGQEQAKAVVARLRHGRMVEVPNAGHTVPGDNPAGFQAAVRPFLRELVGA